MNACCDADRVVNLLTDFRNNNYYFGYQLLMCYQKSKKT